MAEEHTKEVSKKEMRQDFYSCRNFELSNLWQRSIFLSVFLVLCFSGYGLLLVKIIEVEADNMLQFSLFNLVAVIIGGLSLLFSILWILMGKGSKAWYEVYETAIWEIDQESELNIDEKYRMGNLPDKGIDHNIFTGKGGGYSVSKINIAIGQVCFWIWLMVIAIHSLINIISIHSFLYNNLGACEIKAVLIISYILPFIILFFAGFIVISKWLKSSYLGRS